MDMRIDETGKDIRQIPRGRLVKPCDLFYSFSPDRYLSRVNGRCPYVYQSSCKSMHACFFGNGKLKNYLAIPIFVSLFSSLAEDEIPT
jgi:hypothetical protein